MAKQTSFLNSRTQRDIGLSFSSCYKICFCLLLIFVLLTENLVTCTYLNKIAVHVRGGRSVADGIAKKYGYINHGQIGSLKDHYLFEHSAIEKRSAQPNHEHHKYLENEQNVLWFEQQVEKKRVKRDLTFNDPGWPKEWYLHGGGQKGFGGPSGFDMGVKGAWDLGFTGKGVVVTILDDGIERNHPDLIANYDAYASTDINDNDPDPMPRYDYSNENRHGTRCAGEVSAMANNSNCAVGVAYHAGIGGVRMLDGSVYDQVEARSLSHNHTHVDIYSASWGPDDDGRVVDGPGPLAKKAFAEGIKTGRGGLGNIFMWASGNGGRVQDSCSCDGYTNSIFTLSISSTSMRGTKPWYLEECSSTLATTYSSGAADEKQITTTDLHQKCTDLHTGTSASAPLAAGLVALALEANPQLTWRDVQYITMLSANPEPMADGEWKVNAMGRKVSLKYGYGLMNATKMVNYALQWTTVPPQCHCTKDGGKKNQALYEYVAFEDEIHVDGCAGTADEIRYLEHVQVHVTLNYQRRGDLTISVSSPKGTNSTLLPKRNRDMSEGGFNDWAFLSVHFWQENPVGTWKISIMDKINSYGTNQKGLLKSWSLSLYGTKEQPINLQSGRKTNPPSPTPLVCDQQCIDTCRGPGPEGCDRCKYYKIHNGPCVQTCPTGYRPLGMECLPCHPSCEACALVNYVEQCQRCAAGYIFSGQENNTCVSACELGTFFSKVHNSCLTCSQQCEACEKTAEFCTKCPSSMTLRDNKCVLPSTICPEGQYRRPDSSCALCDRGCRLCDGPGRCIHCQDASSYIQTGYCVALCSSGFLPHVLQTVEGISRKECRKCNQGVCNSCTSGFKMTDSVCVQENACRLQEYYDFESLSCMPCHKTCSTCHGPSGGDCNSCQDKLMFHPLLQACIPCCLGRNPKDASCCRCDAARGQCIVESKSSEGELAPVIWNTAMLAGILGGICLLLLSIVALILIVLKKNRNSASTITSKPELSTSIKYQKLATEDI